MLQGDSMNEQHIVNKINNIFIWTTRLAFLNLLWLVFMIFGLVVFGVFPATVASLSVCMYWINGKTDLPIWKTFKREFLHNFYISNGAGWLLLLAGSILFINYQHFDKISGVFYFFSIFSFYFVIIIYIALWIWVFPLMSHYNNKLTKHFFNSLILGFGKIKTTLLIILLLFLVIYISLSIPGMIPFFSFSIGSYFWAWFSLKVINEIDEENP